MSTPVWITATPPATHGELPDLGGLAQVTAEGVDAVTGRAHDFRTGAFGGLDGPRRYVDLGAEMRESDGERATEIAGRSGHDDTQILEFHVCLLSPRIPMAGPLQRGRGKGLRAW